MSKITELRFTRITIYEVNWILDYDLRRAANGKMLRNFDTIPTALDILHVNLITCYAKFNFSSIVTPKHFADLLIETGL